jgi:hypothetical protein
MKRGDHFMGQRLKKRRRHLKMPFCKPYRAPGFPFHGNRPDFRHRDVPFAYEDPFPLDDPVKILGKVGFHFINIEPNHDSILD